jgi:predicted aspartyl protease
MLIAGTWHLCPDGIVRPVFRGGVCAADSSWVPVPFLADTGADCTVLSANVFQALRLPPLTAPHQVGGVGGVVASVAVDAQIRFFREDGTAVVFRGQYTALTSPDALDMSVLGRDVTNLFALIVDRPRDIVCLLGQRHRYTIAQA